MRKTNRTTHARRVVIEVRLFPRLHSRSLQAPWSSAIQYPKIPSTPRVAQPAEDAHTPPTHVRGEQPESTRDVVGPSRAAASVARSSVSSPLALGAFAACRVSRISRPAAASSSCLIVPKKPPCRRAKRSVVVYLWISQPSAKAPRGDSSCVHGVCGPRPNLNF